MSKLTAADSKKWHLNQAAHYNGGPEFFAYGYRCVEQPRLYRFDRYDRKTKAVTSTWSVDGSDCVSLEEAVERLNTPPVFTAEELEFLTGIPETFTEMPMGMDWELVNSTQNKGAAEWEAGKCRITDVGRIAIRNGSGS